MSALKLHVVRNRIPERLIDLNQELPETRGESISERLQFTFPQPLSFMVSPRALGLDLCSFVHIVHLLCMTCVFTLFFVYSDLKHWKSCVL